MVSVRVNANIPQDFRCRRLCDSHLVSVHSSTVRGLMLANLRHEAILLGKIGNHTASLMPSEISALSKVQEPVT